MKKLFFINLSIFFIFNAYAQTPEDIDLVQSIWGKEKREMITEVMEIPSYEETAFWEAYGVYENERKKLGKERIDILSLYAEKYGNFTDETISDLMQKSIKNNMDIQKLYKKTFKSMSKNVSPKTAAHFLQLENYIQTAIQLEIQQNIPFIDEIKLDE